MTTDESWLRLWRRRRQGRGATGKRAGGRNPGLGVWANGGFRTLPERCFPTDKLPSTSVAGHGGFPRPRHWRPFLPLLRPLSCAVFLCSAPHCGPPFIWMNSLSANRAGVRRGSRRRPCSFCGPFKQNLSRREGHRHDSQWPAMRRWLQTKAPHSLACLAGCGT